MNDDDAIGPVFPQRAKPDIREQVGRALNSSRLAMRPAIEDALTRVAAFGAATLEVQLGINRLAGARGREALAGARPPQPRDRLSADLGALLWHVRYARQHEFLMRAHALFVEWLMLRPQFAEIEPESARRLLLEPFAEIVLHEWLSDRCMSCGGSGRLERIKGGVLVRPRGSMQRNAAFVLCRGCGGSGRARPNHRARARTLGIPKNRYFEQHWPARFTTAFTWLTQLGGRLSHPLTKQLERRKKIA